MKFKSTFLGVLALTIASLLAGLFSTGWIARPQAAFKADKPSVARPSVARPNILFIITDDHTWQAISSYGGKYMKTPNIDRLAREGALFRNCLVTNSICGPSRATLLTGAYSHVNGYKFNEKVFDNRQWVFTEDMQKNGYQTAWVGKLHLGSFPKGFDYINVLPGHGDYYNSRFVSPKDTVRSNGYVTNVISDYALDFLKNRNSEKPFMLVVGHKATHRTWFPDLPDLGAFDKTTFPLPPTFRDTYAGRKAAQQQDMSIEKTMVLSEDLKVHLNYNRPVFKQMSAEQRQKLQDYYEGKVSREFDSLKLTGDALTQWKYQRYMRDYMATAQSLDRNVGRLLDYLDQSGLSKNTVVVYTSDQGFYLGEHGWFDKRFIYEESLKTPFIIRYPGVVKPGTERTQLVSNIDWAPTLMDIGQTPVPAQVQGQSFLPLLRDPKVAGRKAVYYHYYEYPAPHRVSPHFGLRTDRYTLARFYGPDDFWELYDLKKDPQQLSNVYGQPAYASITADLKKQMQAEIERYKDKEAGDILATKL